MKRFIPILIILISCLFLTSCKVITELIEDNIKDPNESHQHEFSTYITFDADSHYRICTKDGCDEKTEIEAHTFEDWKEEIAPTHYERGFDMRQCSVCKYYYRREVPRTPHTLIHHEKQEPTCMKVGYEEYYECTECKKNFKLERAYPGDEIKNLKDISIPEINHLINGCKYEYIKATDTRFGALDLYCICGIWAASLVVPFYEKENETVAYEWSYDDNLCEDNYKHLIMRKSFYEEKIAKELAYRGHSEEFTHDFIKLMEDDGVFDEVFSSKMHERNNHKLVAEFITKPTMTTGGSFKLYCKKCNTVFVNNDNSEITSIPSGIDGCFGVIKTIHPSCEIDGYTEYGFNSTSLIDYIKNNYSNDYKIKFAYTSDFDTSNIKLDTFKNYKDKLNHNYIGYLNNPTLANDGSFEIKCTRCEKNYTNTANNNTVIPKLTSSEYYNFSSTVTCEKAGTDKYEFNTNAINSLIMDSLGITLNDVNKYFIFKDILINKEALGHVFDNDNILIKKYPKYTEAGIAVFPCDRANCSYLRQISEGVTELNIPCLNDLHIYNPHSITATCQSAGELKVHFRITWPEENIPLNWSNQQSYVQKFRQLIEEHTYIVDSVRHEFRFSIDRENLIVHNYCDYDCKVVDFDIKLPEISSGQYEIKEVEATCIKEGYKEYVLSNSIINNLYRNHEKFHEDIDLQYTGIKVSAVLDLITDVGYDYDNHVGVLSFDSTCNISFPSFNRDTDTKGMYAHKCSACEQRKYMYFYFSEGNWIDNDTYAQRKYVIEGNTYIDPTHYTSFNIYVDYGAGVPYYSHSITELNVDIDCNTNYDVSILDYRLNGLVAKDFEVYVDHKRCYSSVNHVIKRKSLDVIYVEMFFSKGFGNVYIKVIY